MKRMLLSFALSLTLLALGIFMYHLIFNDSIKWYIAFPIAFVSGILGAKLIPW